MIEKVFDKKNKKKMRRFYRVNLSSTTKNKVALNPMMCTRTRVIWSRAVSGPFSDCALRPRNINNCEDWKYTSFAVFIRHS